MNLWQLLTRWRKPKVIVSPHIPMLSLNGKRIRGLKRCINCGLNESYWERWPVCEYAKKSS